VNNISRQHIHLPTNILDKATDTITAFSGSWLFLALHMLWFGLWIGFHVEPFPFGLLTMIVSLEAIFLSTLVMMSQNRQTARDHKRDDHEAEIVDTMPAILSTILDLSKDVHTMQQQQMVIFDLLKQEERQIMARLDEMKGTQHIHPLRVRKVPN
jgi:uncharacterized membrane protein